MDDESAETLPCRPGLLCQVYDPIFHNKINHLLQKYPETWNG